MQCGAVWCSVVQPNCSCTFTPIADNGNSFGIDIGTIPPLLSHFIPPEWSFTKTFIANTEAVKKVGIIILIILPDMVTGQQQKSPSMLHTAGTPQSHLSFGVNSNMTVTFNLGQNSFFTNQYVTGGKRTKRPRTVPAIRGQPRLRGNSAKRNLLFAPKPAHL